MKLRKIFAAFLLCLSVGSAMAQMPAIPVDKNVKIGHLDNGLTYYIRHNSYPEHVASFYIAQKWVLSMRTMISAVWLISSSTSPSMVPITSRVIPSRITCRASVWSMVEISMPIPA